MLRSLWRHIPRVALLEFKSVARDFAAGDLYRLVAWSEESDHLFKPR